MPAVGSNDGRFGNEAHWTAEPAERREPQRPSPPPFPPRDSKSGGTLHWTDCPSRCSRQIKAPPHLALRYRSSPDCRPYCVLCLPSLSPKRLHAREVYEVTANRGRIAVDVLKHLDLAPPPPPRPAPSFFRCYCKTSMLLARSATSRSSGFIVASTRTAARHFSRTPAAAAMVKPGDSLPSAEVMENSPGNKINLAEVLKGKNGLIIGVPAAFSAFPPPLPLRFPSVVLFVVLQPRAHREGRPADAETPRAQAPAAPRRTSPATLPTRARKRSARSLSSPSTTPLS